MRPGRINKSRIRKSVLNEITMANKQFKREAHGHKSNASAFNGIFNYITHNHSETLPPGLEGRDKKEIAVNKLILDFLSGNKLPFMGLNTEKAKIYNALAVQNNFKQFQTWLNTIY